MYIASEIKSALSIQRVVEYYGFTPKWNGFIPCPFHQGDHTPSLKIYEGTNTWKCFGCGRGGSVIDFVMELFDLSFQQAVIRLSADFHLGLTQKRLTKKDASKIMERRKAEEENKEKLRLEYIEKAREHCYWWEVTKYFAPDDLCGKTGYIHPLYAEALKRLPYLEYWLDENLGAGR